MRALNQVQLIGRLGADPEVRYTGNGDAVCTLSVATNEQWTDKQTGEVKEQTEWHRCVLWRRLAELAGQYLSKGSRVYVAGQLKTRKWQDSSGADRYTTEVQVRGLLMLDGQQQGPEFGQQPGQQQRPPQHTRGTGQQPQHRGNGQQPPAPPLHAAHFDAQAPGGGFDDDIPF